MAKTTTVTVTYAVMQMGCIAGRYATRAEAEAVAEAANAEADEECGEDVCGDGAASVIELDGEGSR